MKENQRMGHPPTGHTYTWDADGNMISVDGTTVTMAYDAFDRMIEQTRSSGHTEIAYGPYGMKLALMNGQSLVSAFVKIPGGGNAVYTSSGLTYYRHADHLGSSRLSTKTTKGLRWYQSAYAPYGEDYAQAGDHPDLAFTDENQDTVAGGWAANLYDFTLREYRPAQGRWTSPDPAGLNAVDPTNPQTWNRYAYVLNNPLAMVDLLGDDGCYGPGGVQYFVSQVNCYSYGGNWLGGSQWVGSDGNVYGPQTTQVTSCIDADCSTEEQFNPNANLGPFNYAPPISTLQSYTPLMNPMTCPEDTLCTPSSPAKATIGPVWTVGQRRAYCYMGVAEGDPPFDLDSMSQIDINGNPVGSSGDPGTQVAYGTKLKQNTQHGPRTMTPNGSPKGQTAQATAGAAGRIASASAGNLACSNIH